MRAAAVSAFAVALLASVGRAQKPELVVQTGHVRTISSLAFSPDGRTLASGSEDNTVKLWDVQSGRQLRTLAQPFVYSVAFSPDGRTLASGSSGGRLKLWDVTSGSELHSLVGHTDNVVSLAFSPDGRTLASGSFDYTYTGKPQPYRASIPGIKLWDVQTGRELRSFVGHTAGVWSVAFSPDGRMLASGSMDSTIKLWDVHSGRALRTLSGHKTAVLSVAFSPDGRTLASAGEDNSIRLWEVATGRQLQPLTTETEHLSSVAFSPDGRTLVSADKDNALRLWDVASGRQLRTLSAHAVTASSIAVAFSSDGHTLASTNEDNTIILWDATTGSELRRLSGQSDPVSYVAVSPNGRTIASTAAGDNTIKIWEGAGGHAPLSLAGHTLRVYSVAFSPDGRVLASASMDHSLKLWDLATGHELRTLPGRGEVFSVAFSPDGKTLAAATDHFLVLWDTATWQELQTLTDTDWVSSVAFSGDGKILASRSGEDNIRFWDTRTWRQLGKAIEVPDVTSLVLSPTQEIAASGSAGGQVKLWNVTTGLELRPLAGLSKDDMWCVAFSPDGRNLAAGSFDGSVKRWDVASGHALRTLRGHSADVRSVTFSPDGRLILSGSSDGSLRIWNAATGEPLATLFSMSTTADWLVVTPDGLFDGSPDAWKKILWRFNNNTFDVAPVEAHFREFYYPGLLGDILAGKHPQAKTGIPNTDPPRPVATVKPASIGAQLANQGEPAQAGESKAKSLCDEGASICVPGTLENSLISGPMGVTVSVDSSSEVEVGWEVADSTGQILESAATSDYRFPLQTESQTRKTLRIRDYVLRPSKSNSGTLTLVPSRFDSSGKLTELPGLKIPVRLDTRTSVLTFVLPTNHDEFIAEVAQWVDNGQQGDFASKGSLLSQTVTVMHVSAADIVGATAEAVVRAWPSGGIWHVIDSHTDGDTAHVTLNGDGWMGVSYYIAEVDFIITQSLLRLPGVKQVKFDEAPSE